MIASYRPVEAAERRFIAGPAADALGQAAGHGRGRRQGCDQSHVPGHRRRRIHPQHAGYRKPFEMEAIYVVRINHQGQIVDTIGTMGQLGLLPHPE